jgi:membrane-associated phospholipid phosphatase
MAARFRPLRQTFSGRRLPVTIRSTEADVAIAHTVARKTSGPPEKLARALTWGADEKVLLALTAIGWLASRGAGEPARRAAHHAVLVAAAASLLPHGMKRLFDQTRPDRMTVVGHLHGVSFSGKRKDAFPSGHALHMGALASAAGALPVGPRRTVRTLAIVLSLTRIAVLAHWASDVVAGFAVGMALERFLRCLTGFPQREVHGDPYPKGPASDERQSRNRSSAG